MWNIIGRIILYFATRGSICGFLCFFNLKGQGEKGDTQRNVSSMKEGKVGKAL